MAFDWLRRFFHSPRTERSEVNYSIGISIACFLQNDAQPGRGYLRSRGALPNWPNKAALFNAQRWFTRERSWINDQQLQLCRIPAPTFFEQQRAEWFRDRLSLLGWDARLDRAGNVLATQPFETKNSRRWWFRRISIP